MYCPHTNIQSLSSLIKQVILPHIASSQHRCCWSTRLERKAAEGSCFNFNAHEPGLCRLRVAADMTGTHVEMPAMCCKERSGSWEFLPSENLPLASLYKAAEMPRHRANHLCTLVYRLCSCSRRKVSSEQWLRLHLITSSVQKFCSEESVEISNGKVINKQQHCPVLEKIAFCSV